MGQWIWGSMHGHTLHMRKRYRSAEIAAAGAQALPIASHAWTREPDSHAPCLNAADSYSVNASLLRNSPWRCVHVALLRGRGCEEGTNRRTRASTTSL